MRPVCIFAWLAALSLLRAEDQTVSELHTRTSIAFREGRLVAAEVSLRELLERTPSDPDALGFLALVLDDERKYSEAEAYYLRALELAPHSIMLLNNAGNHYAQAGDPARSRELFLRLIALDLRHRNANLQLARMAVDKKCGASALVYLDRVDTGREFAPLLLRTEALYWAGDVTGSANLVRALRSDAGRNSEKLTAVGLMLGRTGKWSEAEEVLAQALQAGSSSNAALYNVGLAAAHTRHWDRAGFALESALHLEPGDIQSAVALAQVYASQGLAAQAVRLLLDCRKRAPENPRLLLTLARALEELRFFGDAVVAYEEYIRLAPDNSEAKRDRAFVSALSGHEREAIAELASYCNRFPNDPEGLSKFGMVLSSSDLNRSLKLLTRSLALDPSSLQTRFAHAIVLKELGRRNEALPELEKLHKAHPGIHAVDLQLGVMYLSAGSATKSVAVLTEADRESPDDPAVLASLGRALNEAGRLDEARAAFAKIRSTSPRRTSVSAPIALAMFDLSPAERINRRIADLERSSEMQPADGGIRLQLAAALFEAHRKADAVDALEPLTTSDSDRYRIAASRLALDHGEIELAGHLITTVSEGTALAVLTKAELHDAQGCHSEAVAELAQVIQTATPNMAVEAASLLMKWGESGQAATLLAHAALAQPHSQKVELALAVALERSGQTAKADSTLQSVESRWPESAEPYLVHGTICAGRSDYAGAARMLKRAEALGAIDAPLAACVAARSCPPKANSFPLLLADDENSQLQ